MPTSYVTTAIPYVNSDPHVGFALEALIADATARHRRLSGDDVRFLSGTDDNSLKSVQAAEREGVAVGSLVEHYSARFEALPSALDLSVDDFIRTSIDPRHRPGVERLWRECAESGDIYKGHYRGRYCIDCEAFIDDQELDDGCCPEHHTMPEEVDEENWFFRLSRYQDRLDDLIASGGLRVVPDARRNEVLSFIRSGLRDFSISRSATRARGWGVPVPGDPTQVMYVWFDALGNYITALDYARGGPLYDTFWCGSDRRIHVIGKDIIRFHAVYWPAMLISAGAPLPTTIVAHGFVTAEGRKMSKSLGNVIDPFALVDEFGSDVVRYFLLRHIRTTGDGDFSRQRLMAVRDSELADQLGNLVSRVVSMVDRYLRGVVPENSLDATRLAEVVRMARVDVDAAMERFSVHDAVRAAWRIVEEANRYVVETSPWELARRGDPSMGTVLGNLCALTRSGAAALKPFIPCTADEIQRRIGEPGSVVVSGRPLFPKSAH